MVRHKESHRRTKSIPAVMPLTSASHLSEKCEGIQTSKNYYSTPATPGDLTPPLSRKSSVFFNPTHELAAENHWFYRSAAKVASEGLEERGESWIVQAEDDLRTVYLSESEEPKKRHSIERKDGQWGKFVGSMLAWWEEDDNDILDEFSGDSAQPGTPEKRREDGDWATAIEAFSMAALVMVGGTKLGKWFL